jgi:hypothetical protein
VTKIHFADVFVYGAFVELCFLLAITTIPDNSGNLDPMSKFVQVSKAPTPIASQDFRVTNIVGYGQIIPEIDTSSMKRDGWNERWIIHRPIALATWNDLYNYSRENGMLCQFRGNVRKHCLSVHHRSAITMQSCTQ